MNLESRAVARCQRHPREVVVGVCAACLRERLACVDPADRHAKALPTIADGKASAKMPISEQSKTLQKKKMVMASEGSTSSSGPQLRRSKSFSEGRAQVRAKIDEDSSLLEPKRRSCEIRVRNTLWDLFQIDQAENQSRRSLTQVDEEGPSSMEMNGWVSVSKESEIEVGRDTKQQEEPEPETEPSVRIYESFETGESSSNPNPARTIKSHIDLDTQNRFHAQATETNHDETKKRTPNPNPNSNECGDSKERPRTFWLTAIVRKRIQKWKRKNRHKQHHAHSTQTRDTRSEVFDEARPSCDDDPRFSIDMGRTSWEDSRHSWEEPRASWDGILVGKLVASSVGGHEEASVSAVGLSRNQVLVEPIKFNGGGQKETAGAAATGPSKNQVLLEPIKVHGGEEESQPGGALETREYYSDSSLSRRRRKNAVEKETDESKSVQASDTRNTNSNTTKVSPATLDDENSKAGALNAETEKIHRGEKCSENLHNHPSHEVGDTKQVSKSHRWSKAWSRNITSPMWGFIQKHGGGKYEGGYEGAGGDIEGCHSDSWREFQREKEGRRTLSKGDFLSNSSISSRSWYFHSSSNRQGGLVNNGSIHRSNSNNNAQRNKSSSWQVKRREEMMLDRSRSIHYSPTNVDNGLLRFYLTPLRSSRRSGNGGTRIRPPNSSSRSALGLY